MSVLQGFYGSHLFDPGEIYPKLIEVVPVFSDRGRRWASDYRMTVGGEFCGDLNTPLNPETIDAKIGTLESALLEDYRDFGFLRFDGTSWVPTQHYMRNDSQYNLSGNKILRRSWVHGGPTEFANTRSYNFTVGARFRESYSSIVTMRESVAFYGTGGPDWVYRETWNTPPVRDDLNLHTVVHVVQSGSITALDPYPNPNPPLFPDEERTKLRGIFRTSPNSHGSNLSGRLTHYTVSWTYHMFLALVPLRYPTAYT